MAAESTHTYELIYVLDSVLDEKGLKEMVDRVNKFIKKSKGEVLQVEEWGIRNLEYPINKRKSGYYVNLFFTGTPDIAPTLEKALRINEHIFRYMVLKLDAKMLRYFEKTKGSSSSPDAAKEAAEEEAKSGAKPDSKPAAKAEAKPAAKPAAKAEAKPAAE